MVNGNRSDRFARSLRVGLAALVAGALLASATPARATNASGKLTGVFVYPPNSLIFFQVDGYSGGPSCNATKRYVLSSTDPNANQILAVLLTAYASQSYVVVQGSNVCSLFGNSETALQVCLGTLPCF